MRKCASLFVIAALWLTACGSPSTGGYAPLPGQPAADANATLTAYGLREQATRVWNEQATITARNMTQAAVAQETAVSAQATQQAISTLESLNAQATQQAIYLDGTRAALEMYATSDAQQRLAYAEQLLISDEATRVAIMREAERVSIERARLWNATWPWLVGAAVLALLSFVAFIIWRWRQLSKIVVHENQVYLPVGAYQAGVRISAPRREERPLLPPPSEDAPRIVTMPAERAGHILIAGETGSGKSTAMRYLLEARRNVIVLDPHSAGGADWAQARVIGAGRDFEAIADYMLWMRQELSKRYQQRAQGQHGFEALTVATDEMPAIVATLGAQIDETWREWLREGRKVGLYFVVSTQSTRVRTLGIRGEGDLLDNFAGVLVLGQLAINEYGDLVRGMERPAVWRTLRGAQPVVIPHNPDPPRLPPTNGTPPRLDAGIDPQRATPENVGMYVDGRFVPPSDVRKIKQMTEAGESGRAIERAVFGFEGGQAFNVRKEVVERLNLNGATATDAA